MKKITILAVFAMFFSISLHAQDKEKQEPIASEYGGGLKVSLSEDGKKYFRLITWHQFWLEGNNIHGPQGSEFSVTPKLRRSRFLMFAQLTDRFLIVTHFGLNNLTPAGMHPTGQSSQAQLFMHDAWAEIKVNDWLYLGGGLHYWNGISRLNNQSTLNFLPLDNPRHAWATIGTSDQFARHLGVYAKGKVGKLDYRFAWNFAMINSADKIALIDDEDGPQNGGELANADYVGAALLGTSAQNIFAGYVNYQFWDQESNKLPYFVGTYFGKKRVLNVGAGFFSHPKGTVRNLTYTLDDEGNTVMDTYNADNVMIWAADVFTELPFGGNGAALTGYLQYQNNNYGENFMYGRSSQSVFTGSVIYFQGGVLLPFRTGDVAWQPYATVTNKSITNLDGNTTDFGIGINSLITGHHAKISLEYRYINPIVPDGAASAARGNLILQTVVFL